MRTAVYDLVTGKLVANSEGQWTAVDGKDTFAGFTPKEFAGYTTNPNKVEQVKVTGNDKDSEVTVTYTVNTQTGKISEDWLSKVRFMMPLLSAFPVRLEPRPV